MSASEQPGLGLSNCGGVIVTFHPDQGLDARLDAMVKECGRLVIVDNSADCATSDRLTSLRDRLGCQLLLNSSNLGIAAALNLGFAELMRQGCDWAIAFDQDSFPEPGFVDRLTECALRLSATQHPVAVVGANWVDDGRPTHPSLHLRPHPACRILFQRVPASEDLDDVTCVITSGSLFHLPIWRLLGGFDESLFLDLVDTDYCLRARRAGHRISVAADAHLLHHRGSKRPVRFLGCTWWPAFMPPQRLYYLFRNRILLCRHALWQSPHWVSFEMVYAAKVLTEIIFLENDKAAKIRVCLRGTWDGLLGRRGAAA